MRTVHSRADSERKMSIDGHGRTTGREGRAEARHILHNIGVYRVNRNQTKHQSLCSTPVRSLDKCLQYACETSCAQRNVYFCASDEEGTRLLAALGIDIDKT